MPEHSSNNYQKQQTPCLVVIKCVKFIPVLFILSIFLWSYYAYVFQLCILYVQTVYGQIFMLLFYHILFFMFLWAYWQTIFTPIRTVPSKFHIPPSEVDRLSRADSQETQKQILETFAKDLPISNRTITGTVRYCYKCMLIKPDRAHHCSVCGTCVLKMDHHCPWVNSCVNFSNYKFFILFLGYALLYCIYISLTSLKYFILFWEGKLDGGMGRFHILFLFFVSVMFAVSLVSLFGYHLYLVALNRTTLEAFRAPIFRVGGPDKNGYHLGHYNNFQEVFGDDWKVWFLPVFSSLGDGLVYPTHSQHLSTVYESINNSPSSRVDIERGDEIKPLGTVLIDVAEHTTENNRNKSDNVL